jgi:hypothetical protein
VTFGPGYQEIEPLIIYRSGTPRPRKLTDLVGGRLDVVASSSHAALLEKLRQQEPLLTWVEHTERSSDELIRRVAEGEIDYTVADSNLFELLRQFYPDLRVAFPLGPTDRIAWALPKGDVELRESIASYFAEIEATGELKQILDRYYFASREFDYVGSRAFMRHVDTRLPRYRDFFLEAERSTGIDWRLIAAIAYQESHWDPAAISPTGVRGMMMLTTHTADMMEVGDRHDARSSILGGAHYYERVRGKVPERIREPRPLLACRRLVQLGLRASRGRAHPHSVARRGSRQVGRSPRAPAVAERQGLVQPRTARVRARADRGHVRRKRAPLLRNPHVARQSRDADVARVRASGHRADRLRRRIAAASRREESLQQGAALFREHAATTSIR